MIVELKNEDTRMHWRVLWSIRVAVWLNGSTLVSINEVTLLQAQLVLGWGMGDRVRGSTSGAGNLSQYLTSHPGQLSLAIPLWVGTVSTSQRMVMFCSWGAKAGMVGVWLAGKIVWSPSWHRSYLSASEMRFFIMRCYTTRPYFPLLLHFVDFSTNDCLVMLCVFGIWHTGWNKKLKLKIKT